MILADISSGKAVVTFSRSGSLNCFSAIGFEIESLLFNLWKYWTCSSRNLRRLERRDKDFWFVSFCQKGLRSKVDQLNFGTEEICLDYRMEQAFGEILGFSLCLWRGLSLYQP